MTTTPPPPPPPSESEEIDIEATVTEILRELGADPALLPRSPAGEATLDRACQLSAEADLLVD